MGHITTKHRALILDVYQALSAIDGSVCLSASFGSYPRRFVLPHWYARQDRKDCLLGRLTPMPLLRSVANIQVGASAYCDLADK